MPLKGTGGARVFLLSLSLSLSSSGIILLLESPFVGDYGEATTEDLVRCSVEEGAEAMSTRARPGQAPAYRFVTWKHASRQCAGAETLGNFSRAVPVEICLLRTCDEFSTALKESAAS